MKNRIVSSVCAMAFLFVVPLNAGGNTALEKAGAKLKEWKEAKENQALISEVIDTINDEIQPYPNVQKNPDLRKALMTAKKVCIAKPDAEECLVDMDLAFDLAVKLVEEQVASKKK